MNSREKILSAIRKNQPEASTLPDINITAHPQPNAAEHFSTTLVNIGGAVLQVNGWDAIISHIQKYFPEAKRIVSTIPEVSAAIGVSDFQQDPHLLENVTLAILPGHFGVAENGAIWITDELLGDRALPFICEHLALVISKENIFHTLHDAYEKIGSSGYDFGTFIAGPSKTADIEQSLVLGAHGPKSMTVFLKD